MEKNQLFIQNQKDLEDWLEKNHDKEKSVWLVFYKKSSGKAEIGWEEIVDSILCYGWIDSTANKVDDERTMIRITPRNPKSGWSKINKNKVDVLIKEGRMKPSGLEMVKLAKKTGTWDALNDIEDLIVPKELEKVLKSKRLLEKWNKLAKSARRIFLFSLYKSKREETKLKTIAKICNSLEL